MRVVIFILVLFFIGAPASAFYAEEVSLKRNRDVVIIEDTAAKQQFYGELVGWPHTYTMLIKEKSFFTATVYIPDIEQLENNVNFILVQEVARGVEEVSRIPAAQSAWFPEKDSFSGVMRRRGPTFEAELEPGVYIFEVSTPDNIGKYVLEVGSGEYREAGYFDRLGMLIGTKRFHESPLITIIFVPTVYLPLVGVALIIGAAVVYRRERGARAEGAIVGS